MRFNKHIYVYIFKTNQSIAYFFGWFESYFVDQMLHDPVRPNF